MVVQIWSFQVKLIQNQPLELVKTDIYSPKLLWINIWTVDNKKMTLTSQVKIYIRPKKIIAKGAPIASSDVSISLWWELWNESLDQSALDNFLSGLAIVKLQKGKKWKKWRNCWTSIGPWSQSRLYMGDSPLVSSLNWKYIRSTFGIPELKRYGLLFSSYRNVNAVFVIASTGNRFNHSRHQLLLRIAAHFCSPRDNINRYFFLIMLLFS